MPLSSPEQNRFFRGYGVAPRHGRAGRKCRRKAGPLFVRSTGAARKGNRPCSARPRAPRDLVGQEGHRGDVRRPDAESPRGRWEGENPVDRLSYGPCAKGMPGRGRLLLRQGAPPRSAEPKGPSIEGRLPQRSRAVPRGARIPGKTDRAWSGGRCGSVPARRKGIRADGTWQVRGKRQIFRRGAEGDPRHERRVDLQGDGSLSRRELRCGDGDRAFPKGVRRKISGGISQEGQRCRACVTRGVADGEAGKETAGKETLGPELPEMSRRAATAFRSLAGAIR